MRRSRGFTMVELMVGLAIVALLAALAVPTMRSVIENSRIRAVGESVQNGLALARAEAVRLNTRVEFVIDANGWQVRRSDDDTAVLHQGSGKEGSTGLTLTADPVGTDRITFDAFGRTVATNPSDASNPMTQLDIEAANPSGSSSYRPLRIQMLAGGLSRLCDPAASANEPKACL